MPILWAYHNGMADGDAAQHPWATALQAGDITRRALRSSFVRAFDCAAQRWVPFGKKDETEMPTSQRAHRRNSIPTATPSCIKHRT